MTADVEGTFSRTAVVLVALAMVTTVLPTAASHVVSDSTVYLGTNYFHHDAIDSNGNNAYTNGDCTPLDSSTSWSGDDVSVDTIASSGWFCTNSEAIAFVQPYADATVRERCAGQVSSWTAWQQIQYSINGKMRGGGDSSSYNELMFDMQFPESEIYEHWTNRDSFDPSRSSVWGPWFSESVSPGDTIDYGLHLSAESDATNGGGDVEADADVDLDDWKIVFYVPSVDLSWSDDRDGWQNSGWTVDVFADSPEACVKSMDWRRIVNGNTQSWHDTSEGPDAHEVGFAGIQDEGKTTIEFCANDYNSRNSRKCMKTDTFKLDTLSPEDPRIQSGSHTDQSNWYSNDDVSSSWTQDDDDPSNGGPNSGIDGSQHQLDTNGWSSISFHDSKTWNGVSNGVHDICARVWDVAGNSRTDCRTVRVDTENPDLAQPYVTSGSQAPFSDSNWYNSNVDLAINSDDDYSGIRCEAFREDGGSWSSCDGHESWTETGEGSHTFEGKAVDWAGNKRAGLDSKTIKIDKTDPDNPNVQSSSHSSSGTWYSNGDVDFSWTENDDRSGFRNSWKRLDGGSWESSSSPSSYVGLSSGKHTICAKTRDNAANTESDCRDVLVDTATPTHADPTVDTSQTPDIGENGWYTDDVALYIDSGDSHSGINCEDHANSASESAFDSCSGQDAWTDTSEGIETYYAYAEDKAQSTPNKLYGTSAGTLQIKLDKTSPAMDGQPKNVSWTKTMPSLDSIDFVDPTDSTEENSGVWKAFYKIHTDENSGGTQLKDWTRFRVEDQDSRDAFNSEWNSSIDQTALQQGVNYISVKVLDRAGNQEVFTDVVRLEWDTTVPETVEVNARDGTKGDNGWWTTDVDLGVKSSDSTSGVNCEAHANSNTGPWSQCVSEDTWQDGTEGTESWFGLARDEADNENVSQARHVSIDQTDPTSGASLTGCRGENGWWTCEVNATITGEDSPSGMDHLTHQLDDENWTRSPGTQTEVPVNGDANHTLRFFAVDVAGRTDGSKTNPHTRSIPIDTTAPTSNHTFDGTEGEENWYTSNVTTVFEASDATSGIDVLSYQLGDQAWETTNDTRAELEIADDGEHTVSYFAEDRAGLTDGSRASPNQATVKVDRHAPETNHSLDGDPGEDGWWVSPVNLTLGTTDSGGSGAEETRYGVDDASTPTVYSGTTTLTYEGNKTVYYRSEDHAGNSEETRQVPVPIDTEIPTVAQPTVTSGKQGQNGWWTTGIDLGLDSSDAASGVVCERFARSEQGPYQPDDCTQDVTWNETDQGTHTWYGQATDEAGHVREGQETLVTKIDTTTPNVTDHQPDIDWTKNNPGLNVGAEDAFSGVWKVEYAIYPEPGRTGEALKGWTRIFTASSDGVNEFNQEWFADSSSYQQGPNYISVRVTDRAGHEVVQDDVTRIKWDDVVPSKTKVEPENGSKGDNGWWTSNVSMGVESADNTSGIAQEWHSKNDPSGPWTGGEENHTWTISDDGSDTWFGKAADEAANERVSDGRSMSVDRTEPSTELDLTGTAGANGWWTSDVNASLTVTDATSGAVAVQHQLDGGDWIRTPNTTDTLVVSGDGEHGLFYFGEDEAGNQDGNRSDPLARTVPIDTVPPSTVHDVQAEEGRENWLVENVTVDLNASDATSGVAAVWSNLDGTGWTRDEGANASVNVTQEGHHTVEYYSADRAGLQEATKTDAKSASFKMDRSPPDTTAAFEGTRGQHDWWVSDVCFSLNADDATSGTDLIRYGLNTPSLPNVYNGTRCVSDSENRIDGRHQLYASAVDVAGNDETTESWSVDIDTVKPTINTWRQEPADVDASHHGPVEIEVQTHDETSGINDTEIRYSYDGGFEWSSWTDMEPSGGSDKSFPVPEPEEGWWFYKGNSLAYQVRTTDAAGLVNESEVRTDEIQRVPPEIDIVVPGSDTDGTWGNGTRQIEWTAIDDDHDTVEYEVSLSTDGGSTFRSPRCSERVPEDGTEHTLTCALNTNEQEEGENYVVRVEAWDGVHTVDSVTEPFTIETTSPVVQIQHPDNGEACTLSECLPAPVFDEPRVVGPVELRATAEDRGSVQAGVASVAFSVDGQLVGVDDATDSEGVYSTTWNSHEYAPGRHTVTAQATDEAENPSREPSQDVINVAKPPSASRQDPRDAGTVLEDLLGPLTATRSG